MLMIIILILKCNAAIRKWQAYRNIYIEGHSNCTLRWFPFPFHFLAASAASELIANRSTPTDESVAKPHPPGNLSSNSTPATPPKFTSPFREADVAEGEAEVDWGAGQHPLTISRPPRAGRSERQAEEDQVDRCRLFVEGDPTKNELYSPEYPNLYPKNINCTRVITGEFLGSYYLYTFGVN